MAILAALAAGSAASAAAAASTDLPLKTRIGAAQNTLDELIKAIEERDQPSSENVAWHNWTNWGNWGNWHNLWNKYY
jgi:hypothetical protein